MTTFTTTYYAYDKSHRVTTQYPGAVTGESHYFTFNQRDMIAQIQDVGGSDSNRYFFYNGVGERVVAYDGLTASPPTYFTYDATRVLTEKDAAGAAIGRYRYGDPRLCVSGPPLEVVTSLSEVTSTFNIAVDHDGSVIQSYEDNGDRISYVRDVVGRQLTSKSVGNVFASRLGAFSSDGSLRSTTTEELYLLPSGGLLNPSIAAFGTDPFVPPSTGPGGGPRPLPPPPPCNDPSKGRCKLPFPGWDQIYGTVVQVIAYRPPNKCWYKWTRRAGPLFGGTTTQAAAGGGGGPLPAPGQCPCTGTTCEISVTWNLDYTEGQPLFQLDNNGRQVPLAQNGFQTTLVTLQVVPIRQSNVDVSQCVLIQSVTDTLTFEHLGDAQFFIDRIPGGKDYRLSTDGMSCTATKSDDKLVPSGGPKGSDAPATADNQAVIYTRREFNADVTVVGVPFVGASWSFDASFSSSFPLKVSKWSAGWGNGSEIHLAGRGGPKKVK